MRNANTRCHQCGGDCYIRPGQMAVQKVWFCSRTCHNQHVLDNRKGVCDSCGDRFSRRNEDQKYCSRSCSNKGRTGITYDGLNYKNKAAGAAIRRAKVIHTYGPNCSLCGLEPVWQGRPLVHQVDHIDGNNKNHEISNLRLLCPNCHTQTDTYGAKNIGRNNYGPEQPSHLDRSR